MHAASAILGANLRRAFPVLEDGPFTELLRALDDTGASESSMKGKVVDALGLEPRTR
jgi:hypothetical protein